MIAIVVSRADSASEHVGEALLDLADWEATGDGYRRPGFELRYIDDLHLYAEGVADRFSDPDLLVFASRHSGETGPLLSAHFTGNFGPAEYGGADGTLAAAAPNALARVREALAAHAPEGYDVGVECTHHGPSEVGVPSMFVELGSDEPQWEDPDGARAVARAILDLEGVAPDSERTLVGFGGGHYAPRFDRLLRETPWAVGHVAADWALEAMGDPREGRHVLAAAFERSGAEYALIDGDYPRVEAVVEDLGYRVVGERWVREVGDRPPELAERLEAELSPVAEGLRFGEQPLAESFAVVALPEELLAEAQGIDRERANAAVRERAMAVETVENGARVADRAALPDPDDYEGVVAALAAVLETEYDAVTVGSDAVTAEKRAFVPGRAAELGVPEGPAFGRLADGQAVEVDGRTVDPAEVHEKRTRRFPI